MNKKILLIDADPETLLNTAEAISSIDYEVITVQSGDEALKIISDNSIDLIIMEIESGEGFNGIDIARHILKDYEIPVIFYTLHNEKKYVDKVRNIPHYGYVLKSSGIHLLQLSVDTAFRFYKTYETVNTQRNLLNKYEERYNALITQSPYGIAQLDAGGILREYNDMFLKMLGTSQSMMTGFNTLELTDVKLVTAIKKALAGEISFYEDTYHSVTAENTRPVRIHFTPVKNSGNDLTGVLVIIEDITEWKKMQDTINENKEIFRQIFKQHMAVMMLIEPERGKIINANEAASKFYGYDLKVLRNMSIADINMLPLDEIKTEMKRAKTEERNYYTFPHKLLNGEIRTVEVYVSPVILKGKSILFSIIHDVTERKLAEEKVNLLLKENELILREVHHRIKNNMYTIQNFLMLQQSAVQDPVAVMALQVAESRVQSMMVLYDKLYLKTNIKELSIKEYLSVLADDIIALFPNNKQVTLRKDIADVTFGPDKLFPLGILINELLTNIMKYAFQQKEKGVIELKAYIKDKRLIAEISDDGCGLSGDFDIKKSEGFGIQLVNMLTEQLEGNIRCESSNGTRYILEIPQK